MMSREEGERTHNQVADSISGDGNISIGTEDMNSIDDLS